MTFRTDRYTSIAYFRDGSRTETEFSFEDVDEAHAHWREMERNPDVHIAILNVPPLAIPSRPEN